MDYKYYILKNTYTTDKQSLKPGVTIEKSPAIFTINFKNGEGPFKDLQTLKKKSTIYRNLILRNPKRAQQICEERNINTIKDFVFAKRGLSVSKDFIKTIEHCLKGRVKNGKVSGVHYYDSEKVRILNITRENLSTGIWEAEIEFYNQQTQKWIKKDNPTTFFPNNWSIHQLFHECLYAVNNKEKKEKSENVFVSKTESGIEVEIIFADNVMKSIYPLIKTIDNETKTELRFWKRKHYSLILRPFKKLGLILKNILYFFQNFFQA